MSVESASPVVIDYSELAGATTDELRAKIAEAFGYDGLGLVGIRNVPGMAEARAACLPYARRFGNLPEEVKRKYEMPDAFYSFGWSHGKEKLEGKPDTAKGSFYFNPMKDVPIEDEALVKAYPTFAHPNIWPTEEDCPGMADASKACGQLIVRTGQLLGAHCDNYVASVLPSYGKDGAGEKTTLTHLIANSRCHKARLLYYFPFKAAAAPEAGAAAGAGASAAAAGGELDVSNWCGWHNDHGSLTGLTPAMFFDAEGNAIPCPDPKAGLYIRTRQGKTIRAVIPPDCIAFQIGETAQVHTGGVLQATPHCVRAAEVDGVGRGTLAVFMEPEWDGGMAAPEGAEDDKILRGARGELLPPGVPPLVARWRKDGQSFGDFTETTLSMYH